MPTVRSSVSVFVALTFACALSSPSFGKATPTGPELVTKLDAALAANYAAEATDMNPTLEMRMVLRVRRDQMPREIYAGLFAFKGDERAQLKAALEARGMKIDKENTEWLKSVLPPDFFHNSRNGKTITSGAMLILIHSLDNDWKREWLPKLIPLAEQGEVKASDVALIVDKLAWDDKKPQVYGTQIVCTAGKLAPYMTVDPEAVDARRKKMGLNPVAEYNSSMSVGRAC